MTDNDDDNSSPFSETYGQKPFRGSRLPTPLKFLALVVNIVLIFGVFFGPVPYYVAIGFVIVIIAYDEYPRITTQGLGTYLAYFDLKRPSLRDIGVTIGTLIVMYATLAVLSATLLANTGGASPSGHVLQNDPLGNPVIIAFYVIAFFLFVGPVEEYLFRKKLQRDYLGTYPLPVRLIIASAAFAVVHFPVYGLSFGAAISVGLIFVNALFFGLSYELTDNLTVPALVHATYNTIAILIAYALATGLL